MIDLSLIEKAKREKRIHVFKNPFPNIPDWKRFVELITYYVDKDLEQFPDISYVDVENMENPYLSFQLRCRQWSRFTFQLCDHKDPIEKHIPEAMEIVNWAKENLNYSNVVTFSLVSLMKNRGQIGLKHEDYVDQIQWQCHGTSIWRTGENLEYEDLIEPGDFIFIPKNIWHEIETVSTRAVINLVLEDEEYLQSLQQK